MKISTTAARKAINIADAIVAKARAQRQAQIELNLEKERALERGVRTAIASIEQAAEQEATAIRSNTLVAIAEMEELK